MDEVCPVKLEKVLLAADECEYCEGAVREAVKLARACGGSLYALTVLELNPEFEALAPESVEDMERASAGFLQSVRMRALNEGVRCETIFRRAEDASDVVVEEAGRLGADLVVMGRRGRRGLRRLLMGSVTANVIAKSPCDVLVVPKDSKTAGRVVVAATDGSKYGEAAVSEAAGIASRVGARLYVVSVAPSGEAPPMDIVQMEMERGLVSQKQSGEAAGWVDKGVGLAREAGVEAEGAVLGGEPYGAIVDFAKEKRADLIAVGSHGRTKLRRLFLGSVSERVVGLSACPVLVVKRA